MSTMIFPICEIFGYPYDNNTDKANETRNIRRCPFLDSRCVKQSRRLKYPFGACSVRQKKEDQALIVCPKRFQPMIDEIARWLCEDTKHLVKIPEVRIGQFSIDWVVVCLDDSGNIKDYHGIEVVALDTTGSLDKYFDAYMKGRSLEGIKQNYGINWANVRKRTLPQLIAKGKLLASYGKRLGVVIQDHVFSKLGLGIPVDPPALLHPRKMEDRITETSHQDQRDPNILFFVCRLEYDDRSREYHLILDRSVLVSIQNLIEAGFSVGTKVPTREEFETRLRKRIAELRR